MEEQSERFIAQSQPASAADTTQLKSVTSACFKHIKSITIPQANTANNEGEVHEYPSV